MDKLLNDTKTLRGAVLGLLFVAAIVGGSKVLAAMEPASGMIVGAALFLSVICLFFMEFAAAALIVMMIFSPEIVLAHVPKHDIVIRFDDILIVVLCMSWTLKTVMNRKLKFVKYTPLNLPIAIFFMVSVFSTLNGIANGYVKGTESVFFLLKYLEYYMAFFIFINIFNDRRTLSKFVKYFYATAAAACAWGVYDIMRGTKRISLPFEGMGEANTYGGYLLIVLGLALCMAIEAPAIFPKILFILSSILASVLILFTYSRASYLGMAGVVLAALLCSRSYKRMIFILFLGLLVMISPSIIPQSVVERVSLSFRSSDAVEVAPNIKLSRHDSSYNKYEAMVYVLGFWKEHPVLGMGVTGVGLVDTQYPRVLGETGLVGSLAFAWMLFTIFLMFLKSRRVLYGPDKPDYWKWRGLVDGYICGFAGILIHSLGANTFIIIRIIEPFWFLTAVIASIPAAFEESAQGGRAVR